MSVSGGGDKRCTRKLSIVTIKIENEENIKDPMKHKNIIPVLCVGLRFRYNNRFFIHLDHYLLLITICDAVIQSRNKYIIYLDVVPLAGSVDCRHCV